MITTATGQTDVRCHEIGREVFERARRAEPKLWNRAWWEQQMMGYLGNRPALQTQLFRFTETLPYLTDDSDIASHLKQYVDPKDPIVPLPLRFALCFDNPKSILAQTVGACTRFGAFQMAHSFITGTNTAEAIQNAVRLRSRGMTFTLDVLGESTICEAQGDNAVAIYMELIESLGKAAKHWDHIPLLDEAHDGPMPRANISIKPSMLDPVFDAIDPERAFNTMGARLRTLLRRARELNVFVNVDMESYKHRDLTLYVFKRLLNEPEFRDWKDVGIVVQAYLQDSADDLYGLLDWVDQRGTKIAIRLVKGAYWDSETINAVRNNTRIPVWTKKWQSDEQYEKLTRVMLENTDRIRPAFASHNVRSLSNVMAVAEDLGLTTRHYELQTLAGMGDPLKTALVGMKQCVRVYCPYGNLIQGMAYLIRRLLENTSNDSFLKQGFKDRGSYDRLLANPVTTQPPSAPLPIRKYQDTFEDSFMSGFVNAVNTGFGSTDNRNKMEEAIGQLRNNLGKTYPLVIDGEKVETGQWIETTNPANPQETIGRVAKADTSCADKAVAAAAKAGVKWSHQSAAFRADLVRRAGTLLEERRFDLTALLVLEVGKTWREADAEVTEAIDYCNYHALQVETLAERPRRRNVPGEDNILIHDPCGVCVLISPWDFPLALLCGMISAAVASGNTCVIKPSSSAPVTAAKLFDIFKEARIPAGVINFLPGPGNVVGQHLVEHPDVHLVTFCGSQDVGLTTAAAAAQIRPNQRHIKRTIIDTGAKNAIIIDHDVDLDDAIKGVLGSAFAYSGQKCTACSRVIVVEGVYDKFCEKIAEAAKTMLIGDPADAGTAIGPVIDANAKNTISRYIEEAKKSARTVFEATSDQLPSNGHYVAPIILADVDPKSSIAQEEVFGPVLAVIKANDFDQALAIANDSAYALTGGLYSRSPSHIERARWEFKVGNLYINRKITGSQVDVQPYGGSKLSGDGARLGGPDYLLQYCRPRTISENTLRHGLSGTQEEEKHVSI